MDTAEKIKIGKDKPLNIAEVLKLIAKLIKKIITGTPIAYPFYKTIITIAMITVKTVA